MGGKNMNGVDVCTIVDVNSIQFGSSPLFRLKLLSTIEGFLFWMEDKSTKKQYEVIHRDLSLLKFFPELDDDSYVKFLKELFTHQIDAEYVKIEIEINSSHLVMKMVMNIAEYMQPVRIITMYQIDLDEFDKIHSRLTDIDEKFASISDSPSNNEFEILRKEVTCLKEIVNLTQMKTISSRPYLSLSSSPCLPYTVVQWNLTIHYPECYFELDDSRQDVKIKQSGDYQIYVQMSVPRHTLNEDPRMFQLCVNDIVIAECVAFQANPHGHVTRSVMDIRELNIGDVIRVHYNVKTMASGCGNKLLITML